MRLAPAALLAIALPVLAQSPALQPGDYVLEGGGGSLSLKPAGPGRFDFAIETVGGNAHTCTMDGRIADGVARLRPDDSVCVVRFKPAPDGIEVKADDFGRCQYYCGMRATFEGVFLKPVPACAAKAMAATRRQFKQHYDAKDFARARATLDPLLATCRRFLDWPEEARIRNDLAVTLHKLGEFATCRQVLAPLEKDAAMTDAQVRDEYPPTDAENYLPVVRATRTNLRLCAPR